MSSVIVIQFITLDGIVEDPDGRSGTAGGGWAFNYGPENVAGDKFQIGPRFDSGMMLLGRTTWELFSRVWPARSTEFADRMNRVPKLVATRSVTDVSAWGNSSVLKGDLVQEVRRLRGQGDVVITGSLSVVRELQDHDLVDEYRLLVFPTVLGAGRRLFTGPVSDLRLTAAAQSGAAALLRYERVALPAG